MGVSNHVVNECRSAMMIDIMDISRMFNAEQIEEKKIKQVGRELKRTRFEDGNYSKTIFEVQDKTKFKKRFHNQSLSTIPRVNKGKRCTPKPKEDQGSGPYFEKCCCTKCGKNKKETV